MQGKILFKVVLTLLKSEDNLDITILLQELTEKEVKKCFLEKVK